MSRKEVNKEKEKGGAAGRKPGLFFLVQLRHDDEARTSMPRYEDPEMPSVVN